MNRRSIFRLALLAIPFTLQASNILAQGWWSVGPKMGYTFGEGSHFSVGFEASYLPNGQDPLSSAYLHGYTFDVTYVRRGEFSVHAGMEWMYVIGADVGPTILFSKSGIHPGLGITTFLTFIPIPYYEVVLAHGITPIHAVGGYLKFPLTPMPSHPFN